MLAIVATLCLRAAWNLFCSIFLVLPFQKCIHINYKIWCHRHLNNEHFSSGQESISYGHELCAEVESTQSKRQLCGGSQAAIERMIHFGRELQSMSEHLRRECGKNSANKKMLKVRQRPPGLTVPNTEWIDFMSIILCTWRYILPKNTFVTNHHWKERNMSLLRGSCSCDL